jgi:hypothetical protein
LIEHFGTAEVEGQNLALRPQADHVWAVYALSQYTTDKMIEQALGQRSG